LTFLIVFFLTFIKKVYSGTDGKAIIAWNGTTIIATINIAHAGAISGLKSLNDGRLASVANDGDLKIWNVTTNTLIRTITTSQSSEMYLEYLGNSLLVTGAVDKTVKTWNISATSSAVLINTITLADSIVALKKIDNGFLVGADSTNKIYAWNMKDFTQVLGKSNAHSSKIRDMEALANSTFASCDEAGYARVWTLAGVMINSFQPFGSTMSNCLLRLPDGNLAIGGNSKLGIWKISSLNVFTSIYNLPVSLGSYETKAMLVYQNATFIAAMKEGWLFFYNISKNYSYYENVQTSNLFTKLEQAYSGGKKFFLY
jgi:WD40 repeat protein